MEDVNQIKFEKANEILEQGRVTDFCNLLIELYADMTCNCFLRKQKKSIYENQLRIVKQIKDDLFDFHLNLVKGFVYLMNKEQKEGYLYLTNSINIDNSIDLSYSLRASIDFKINPDYHEDAQKSVLLNPSARNYFILAVSYGKSKESLSLEKSVIYYKKAIQLRPDFACAYNNRAIVYAELDDIDNAIEDYKKCVEVDNTHWAYGILSKRLDDVKRYSEALKYAQLGVEQWSNDIQYQFRLGTANLRLENYEVAIKHYEKYLTEYPDSVSTKNHIAICEKVIKRELFAEAEKQLLLGRSCAIYGNYEVAVSYYKKYLIVYPEDENVKRDMVVLEKDIENKSFAEAKKQFRLGAVNVFSGNYEVAISLYEKYSTVYPENESAKNNILICKKIIKGESLAKTNIQLYDESNCLVTIQSDIFFNNDKSLFDEGIDIYFMTLIKNKNEEIKIGKGNAIYKRLDNLINSYNRKKRMGGRFFENEINANKLIEYESNYEIGFGKYEGKKIMTIIDEDPHYILWCIINLEHFSINKSLLLSEKLQIEPGYLVALEYTLIKELLIDKWRAEQCYNYCLDHDDNYDYSDMQGDWGGLYGEEAEAGYWNTD